MRQHLYLEGDAWLRLKRAGISEVVSQEITPSKAARIDLNSLRAWGAAIIMAHGKERTAIMRSVQEITAKP